MPLSDGGAGSPPNTKWPGPRPIPPYQAASWSIQPFGHNRHGSKIGGCCAPMGELGPHLTQYGQGRGLPPYQVACWSIQPFGHNTPTSQTWQTDRQRSNSIERTVLQTVAQKAYLSSLQGNKNWQICAPFALVKDRMIRNGTGVVVVRKPPYSFKRLVNVYRVGLNVYKIKR